MLSTLFCLPFFITVVVIVMKIIQVTCDYILVVNK